MDAYLKAQATSRRSGSPRLAGSENLTAGATIAGVIEDENLISFTNRREDYIHRRQEKSGKLHISLIHC
jgi:hypothetical protein